MALTACPACGGRLAEPIEARPKPSGGKIALGLMLVVIAGIGLADAWSHREAPPEELERASGVASNASTLKDEYVSFLRFDLGGETFQYPSDYPGYRDLFRAIQNGVDLEIRYSRKKMSIGDDARWPTIYEVIDSRKNVRLVSIAETRASTRKHKRVAAIVCGIMLIVGLSCFISAFDNHER
jgi:hypothetical protein